MSSRWKTGLRRTLTKVRESWPLTGRERQVAALAGTGYTNKDIAHELGITEKTARYHLGNIFEKLGVSNRIELLLFAADQGLTQED